jgi:hypothetical protein
MTEPERPWWEKLSQQTISFWSALVQKAVLFLTGLGLIFHEAVMRKGPERPTLIVLYGAMVGLPFILQARDGGGKSE